MRLLVLLEVVYQQIEVFVERGLWALVKHDGMIRVIKKLFTELNHRKITQNGREVLIVDEVILRVYPFGVLQLILGRYGPPQFGGLLIAPGNDVLRKLHILKPDYRIGWNVLQQRNVAFCKELGLHVGHNGYRMDITDR